MGTKKLKSEYTEYFVLPKTKKTTFIYKTASNTEFTYLAQISEKYNAPITYCTKSKNNLVITSKYFNPSKGKFKTIKTVFKNYFKSKYENRVFFNNFDDESNMFLYEFSDLTLCKSLKGNISDDFNYILGSKKKDNYTLSNNKNNYIFDEKGNDRYNIFSSGNIDYVYDFSGKDKYTIINSSKTKIFDYNGKDSYTITSSDIDIIDYLGKDKYILKDNLSDFIAQTDTLTTIYDYRGNDTYELTNFDNLKLVDEKGKDTYMVRGSKNINIVDKSSNDKYQIFTSNNLKSDNSIQIITDYSGKDSYKLSNCSNFVIEDYENNDKYDIYSLSDKITIDDYSGSNNYNLINSSNITINDKSISSDTIYTLEKITNSLIEDFGGNDSYALTKSKNAVINDYNIGTDNYIINENSVFTINDYGISGDIYNISSSTGEINDSLGNDLYNISNLSGTIEIKDKGGYDTINFKNYDQTDLIFMADFDSEGNALSDMIIYDYKNQGHIKIKDFYKLNENNSYDEINNLNQIEKIQAEKIDLTSKIMTTEELNLISKQAISQWLNNNYNSISMALEAKADNLNELIQIFSPNAG